MRVSNISDFTTELAVSSPDGYRNLYITLTTGLSGTLITQIYNAADTTLQPIKLAAGLVYAVSFQPLPTAIMAKAAGTNSLGLDPGDGNLVLVSVSVRWALASDDAAITAAANAWLKAAKAASVRAGLANEYIYLNYAAPGQDPVTGYGVANRAEMGRVSRKYDPDQIFQRAVPRAFKL